MNERINPSIANVLILLPLVVFAVQPQDVQQRHRPGGADFPGGAVGPGHPRLPALRPGPPHRQPVPGGGLGLHLRR